MARPPPSFFEEERLKRAAALGCRWDGGTGPDLTPERALRENGIDPARFYGRAAPAAASDVLPIAGAPPQDEPPVSPPLQLDFREPKEPAAAADGGHQGDLTSLRQYLSCLDRDRRRRALAPRVRPLLEELRAIYRALPPGTHREFAKALGFDGRWRGQQLKRLLCGKGWVFESMYGRLRAVLDDIHAGALAFKPTGLTGRGRQLYRLVRVPLWDGRESIEHGGG